MDEGYIKFLCIRKKRELLIPNNIRDEINRFRTLLLGKGMIGKIPHGPGFGNLSVRMKDSGFLITGTDTGGLSRLTHHELSLVTSTDIKKNTVWCTGKIDASSESMSHAVVYETNPEIGAVVHIHHRKLWEANLNRLPTTPESIEYGTPELAEAIGLLISKGQRIIVFSGHQDGLLVCGKDLKDATGLIVLLCNKTE